jgi:hypothetical protein
MSDNEISNRITNYIREGETGVRSPRTILMDVNGDMRKAGVRYWRKEGEDRDGWRKFIITNNDESDETFKVLVQSLASSPDRHSKRTFPEQYLSELGPNCS